MKKGPAGRLLRPGSPKTITQWDGPLLPLSSREGGHRPRPPDIVRSLENVLQSWGLLSTFVVNGIT